MAHGCPREPEERYLKARAGGVGAVGLEICWELLWNGPSSCTAAHVSNRPWNTHSSPDLPSNPQMQGHKPTLRPGHSGLGRPKGCPRPHHCAGWSWTWAQVLSAHPQASAETTEMGKRSAGGTGKPATPPVRSRPSPPGPRVPSGLQTEGQSGRQVSITRTFQTQWAAWEDGELPTKRGVGGSERL